MKKSIQLFAILKVFVLISWINPQNMIKSDDITDKNRTEQVENKGSMTFRMGNYL